MQTREEFRRWLIDCHKVSFVPVCCLGADNLLIAEPVVVVANDDDVVEKKPIEDELSPFYKQHSARNL
jgi:hypothetical protein